RGAPEAIRRKSASARSAALGLERDVDLTLVFGGANLDLLRLKACGLHAQPVHLTGHEAGELPTAQGSLVEPPARVVRRQLELEGARRRGLTGDLTEPSFHRRRDPALREPGDALGGGTGSFARADAREKHDHDDHANGGPSSDPAPAPARPEQ